MAQNTRQELASKLKAFLAKQPSDAASICAHLQITQPTFSRLWRSAGSDIVTFGAARATRYSIARTVADIGSSLPLFQVDAAGKAAPFGELRILQGDWYAFTAHTGSTELTLGLPYFLQDLRPQGFLGRLVSFLHADLNLPRKILEWSDDDTLVYLAKRGENAPGDLIVGNESYRRFLTLKHNGDLDCIMESSRPVQYADLAHRANQGDAPGSSAGGEQPKFTCAVTRENGAVEHVIVKFSPPVSTPNGRRWGDLLVCEHLALESLRSHGVTACETEIIADGERIYFEATRFDRIGLKGRASVVSLAGLDCLIGCMDKNWTYSAAMLADKRLLSAQDLDMVRLLDVYGALIGNSDRHPGNLSMSCSDRGAFSLAPAYDMLPMLYRPNQQGEIVERHFDLSVIDRLDLRCLPQALAIAHEFWSRVQADNRISDAFKAIAQEHASRLPASTAPTIT